MQESMQNGPMFNPKISALAIWVPRQLLEQHHHTMTMDKESEGMLKGSGNPKNYITTEKQTKKKIAS